MQADRSAEMTPPAPQALQFLIQISHGTDDAPFWILGDAREQAVQELEAAESLQQEERADAGGRDHERRGDRFDDAWLAVDENERAEAQKSEEEERRHLKQHVAEHAGARGGAADAEERQEPRADQFAANLADRQQIVEALTHDAQANVDGWACASTQRQEPAPGKAGEANGDKTKPDNNRRAPSDTHEGLQNLIPVKPSDEADQQEDAEAGRNLEGVSEHAAAATLPI